MELTEAFSMCCEVKLRAESSGIFWLREIFSWITKE